MHFLDRQPEMQRLLAASAQRDGALVVVWGRRRVGKTRLLLEWVSRTGGLYWVADQSAPALQRRYLAETLGLRFPGFGDVEYPDWRALFLRLGREAHAARWRGPLVIDELPYLVGSSRELPAVLQGFVDHGARKAGLVVAISGSSQRMMQGLVLDANAPLYGRAREILKIRALPVGHLGQAFGLRDARAVIEAWSVWGGVPRYWELAAELGDLRTAVDALVLDPMGPLHDEPARLLLEEDPPAIALRPLLDAIGAGANRVSEIAGRIGQPATSMARPLTRLQELDLVVREIPFGESDRSSKRALYKLADPFLRLWFSLVAPRRSTLLQVPKKARLAVFDQARARLAAFAWEELCRDAVPFLGAVLGRDYGPARRYWSAHGPEWDVVAEASDGTLLVGEAKWFDRAPSAAMIDAAARELLAKGVPPVTAGRPRNVQYALFAANMPAREKVDAPVTLVDAKGVIAALR